MWTWVDHAKWRIRAQSVRQGRPKTDGTIGQRETEEGMARCGRPQSHIMAGAIAGASAYFTGVKKPHG
jgi:hypothetical protein